MRVYGEAYALINGAMDFLSLCLAAGLRQTRLSWPRAAGASVLGAVWAVAAWGWPPWARGLPAAAAAAALMAAVAFGRRWARMTPFLLAGGWLLAGCADFLLDRGWSAWAAVLFSGGLTGALLLLKRAALIPWGGHCVLEITWRGGTARLPAMRDSGNLLFDRGTGLPVIVAPKRALGKLLPEGETPPGCRSIRVQTAAGIRELPCFRPDRVTVRRGARRRAVEATVAAADFRESRALLPDALFAHEGEGLNAGL